VNLRDKVALITGGGRGIGKAIAMAYAREGATIAICARTDSEIDETAREIRALKTDCLALACDVALEESVGRLIKDIEARFGRLDVLVNNAGVMTRPVPLGETEIRKWDYTMAVNLRGPFLVTKASLPLMTGQKSGSIINLSSVTGRAAYANFSAYAASKAGIEGLTRTLAEELRPYGIRVNSVEPGYVATSNRCLRLSCRRRIQIHHGKDA
jgi:3-oxoacyl-[acyl-carrier protein] reductase